MQRNDQVESLIHTWNLKYTITFTGVASLKRDTKQAVATQNTVVVHAVTACCHRSCDVHHFPILSSLKWHINAINANLWKVHSVSKVVFYLKCIPSVMTRQWFQQKAINVNDTDILPFFPVGYWRQGFWNSLDENNAAQPWIHLQSWSRHCDLCQTKTLKFICVWSYSLLLDRYKYTLHSKKILNQTCNNCQNYPNPM